MRVSITKKSARFLQAANVVLKRRIHGSPSLILASLRSSLPLSAPVFPRQLRKNSQMVAVASNKKGANVRPSVSQSPAEKRTIKEILCSSDSPSYLPVPSFLARHRPRFQYRRNDCRSSSFTLVSQQNITNACKM